MNLLLLTALLAGECTLSTADSNWIASSLNAWKRVTTRAAVTSATRYPELVLFDASCTHRIVVLSSGKGRAGLVAAGRRFRVSSDTHGDSIALPDGKRTAAGLTSFAAPTPDGSMFFVMSLPSIWRANNRSDTLASAVFMHEFSHTQTRGLAKQIDVLVKRGLPEDSDDDVIQTRFGDRPAFTLAYEMERDTLFAAVAAPTIAESRRLGRVALALMDRRRATHFVGADALYADAEDLFLSLEGTGQWMAYAWLVDPRGAAMRADAALPSIRRGGRRWSQDEGLALLLLAHRLSADAPKRLFGDRPATIIPLMRELLAPPKGVR